MLSHTLSAFTNPVTLRTEGTQDQPWIRFFHSRREGGLITGEEAGEVLYQISETTSSTPQKVILVSLGKDEPLDNETFRVAAGKAAQWCVKNKITGVQVDVDSLPSTSNEPALRIFLEGFFLGAYRFNLHKTTEDPAYELSLTLVTPHADTLENLVRETRSSCGAVLLARDWGREPANVINPLTLGERCQALFTDTNVKVSILDEKDLAALGAGGLLGVGQGSQTPPRLIILEYPGSGSGVGSPPVVLVGKAITFDTGGYSIKDSPNIQRMKYDKCGGVDVAAILAASAALEMEVPLVGIISAAENMISAQAYRPDDVITTLSGKTVEIVTTDAEGRLVLADALTYAQNHFKPRAIIDLATLTGGVVVALGRVRAGMMANDDPLAQALMDSGEKTHERLWRLPLDDDYFQAIEGDDADLKNSGGREGHAIYGGIFLKQFLNPGIPWAHLDIAGTADSVKDLPYCIKGATGFSVRLILEYLGSLE